MGEGAIRRSRLDHETLQSLGTPSDALGAVRMGGHLGALGASGALIAVCRDSWLLIPAMALHGWVLAFLFAAMHECVHRTAFRSRWLNAVFGRIFGFILVQPADEFRYFHFTHHRYTQDRAHDPELAKPKPTTITGWLIYISSLPLWIGLIRSLLRHAFGRVREAYVPPGGRKTVVREARVHLALYGLVTLVALWFGSPAPLLYWVFPVLLGHPWLSLLLLAQHGGCTDSRDMLVNSRTTDTGPILRFFTWNAAFHAEHHACPAAPFHALPALHRLLRDELKVVAPSHLAVHRAFFAGYRT